MYKKRINPDIQEDGGRLCPFNVLLEYNSVSFLIGYLMLRDSDYEKVFFLPLMLLLTSCFYSEMRVEYAVEGLFTKNGNYYPAPSYNYGKNLISHFFWDMVPYWVFDKAGL